MEPIVELTGLIKEISGKQDEIKLAQQELKDKFAQQESETGKLRDRLSQLEAAGFATLRKPQELNMPVQGTNKTIKAYCGYNLDLQGLGLKRIIQEDECLPKPRLKGYISIADENSRDNIAKYLIDFIRAKMEKDPESMARLVWHRDMARKAALAEGVGSTGGYLIPDEFDASIAAFARLQSVALRDCNVITMSTDVKRMPAESGAVTMTWTDEASPLTQTEPTLAEIVLTAKKVGGFSIASNETLMDASQDIVSWLTSLYAEALALEIDNQVFAGTGSPTSGITTAICGYSVITAGSISTVTGTNLSSMIAKLSANKKIGAKFYIQREVFHYIRTLKDSQSAFIYNPIGGVQANTIWGYPYEEAEKMPATDGTGKPFMLFGNLRYYNLGRRLQTTTLDADPYGKFEYDQTRFRMYWRFGFSVALANAFVRAMTA